jgi:predicted amidophosphoribosyltransferase
MMTISNMKNYPWKRPRIIELPHSQTPSSYSTTSQLVEPVLCGACGTPWSVNETFCGMCGAMLPQEGRMHTSAMIETHHYRFA